MLSFFLENLLLSFWKRSLFRISFSCCVYIYIYIWLKYSGFFSSFGVAVLSILLGVGSLCIYIVSDRVDLRYYLVCCVVGLKKLIGIAVLRAKFRYHGLQNKKTGEEYSSSVFSYNEGTFVQWISKNWRDCGNSLQSFRIASLRTEIRNLDFWNEKWQRYWTTPPRQSVIIHVLSFCVHRQIRGCIATSRHFRCWRWVPCAWGTTTGYSALKVYVIDPVRRSFTFLQHQFYNSVTCKGFAWLIIMGSGFRVWVYWHFFTVTFEYNNSHIELLLSNVCLMNFYEESGTNLSLLWISQIHEWTPLYMCPAARI
jgi:hypothetical protein